MEKTAKQEAIERVFYGNDNCTAHIKSTKVRLYKPKKQ